MDITNPDIWTYLLAAVAVGAGLGLLLRGVMATRQTETVSDEWQNKVDDLSRQRDRMTVEIGKLRTNVETQQGVVNRHEMAANKARTDLESAHEKAKLYSKDLFNLRAERENTKTHLSNIQNHMALVTQRAQELQVEFVKSGEFYKSELKKSFEKRQLLEAKLEKAKLEQESFSNLLVEQRSEQNSVNKILSSAQTRLANLDALEQNVIALEAENAQLNHDVTRTKQEIESLRRDVADLEELKIQNKELAQCLTSMEKSRKQHEADATRHREHAGEAEQHSETLRLKLDEVEQNFLVIEKEQRQALSSVRKEAAAQKTNGHAQREQEVDDLQEIIGIGKVFEHALNELGIVSYRQIANFDMADVARVNSHLKEFRGRMEQDDWIGQAKDLQFKKYG